MTNHQHRRGFFGAILAACAAIPAAFFGKARADKTEWEGPYSITGAEPDLEPYPDAPMERIEMHREDMRHNAEAAIAAFAAGDYAKVERLARDQELLAIEALHAITDRERETGDTPQLDGEAADALAEWCQRDVGWIDRYIDEQGQAARSVMTQLYFDQIGEVGGKYPPYRRARPRGRLPDRSRVAEEASSTRPVSMTSRAGGSSDSLDRSGLRDGAVEGLAGSFVDTAYSAHGDSDEIPRAARSGGRPC